MGFDVAEAAGGLPGELVGTIVLRLVLGEPGVTVGGLMTGPELGSQE